MESTHYIIRVYFVDALASFSSECFALIDLVPSSSRRHFISIQFFNSRWAFEIGAM
jgi:hypothetical protein